MDGVDGASVKLAELLRHPDNLEKIPALKAAFTRKKVAVDTQLKLGLQEQLNTTQSGVSSVTNGVKAVDTLKEDMQRIEKLCLEAQNLITDLPHINLISQTHRNFTLVEAMKTDIENFERELRFIEQLLQEDDSQLEDQPNLLMIHFRLTKLRDMRDSALDQAKRAGDSCLELISNLQLPTGRTLSDYFAQLDELIDFFDDHIGVICSNLIELVSDNPGLVVKFALVIEEEERNDKRARALQEARNEYRDLARHLKSITTNNVVVRGYKEKFLQAVEMIAEGKFDKSREKFREDPDKLDKSLAWWFNDLNTVKLGMVKLMPRKWKIFSTYTAIYHKLMRKFLIDMIEDPELRPPQLLAIVDWSEKYHAKNKKLGTDPDLLQPHVIDNKATELITEYRQLIVKAVDEWMDRMSRTDKQSFNNREEGATDQDERGWFRSKTNADMWRMLSQQLDVASASNRADIIEGVVEAMFRAIQARQRMWEELVETELKRFQNATATPDGINAFYDWLVTIANDQMACIDDASEGSNQGYIDRFALDLSRHVSDEFKPKVEAQLEQLREGYVDTSVTCIQIFCALIFSADFRAVLTEFFTPAWYSKTTMKQIILTFEDYFTDYRPVLHDRLHDVLIQEMSDKLLVAYLSSVRNKGAKFRRSDPFANKIRDDIMTVFSFFEKFQSVFPDVQNRWRVMEDFVDLIEVQKSSVPEAFSHFKENYPETTMSWVEATIRARDDCDRALVNAVKQRAAAIDVPKDGIETIMSKVK